MSTITITASDGRPFTGTDYPTLQAEVDAYEASLVEKQKEREQHEADKLAENKSIAQIEKQLADAYDGWRTKFPNEPLIKTCNILQDIKDTVAEDIKLGYLDQDTTES